MREPNFTKLGQDIGRSSLHFCFKIWISCCIFKSGQLKFECLNDAKFRTFWPPLWKLGEGWARSLYQYYCCYLRPNLRNTFDGCPLRGCWTRWIDKKESSWVKLTAFPTNVWWPNIETDSEMCEPHYNLYSSAMLLQRCMGVHGTLYCSESQWLTDQ